VVGKEFAKRGIGLGELLLERRFTRPKLASVVERLDAF
jgi:hypothetical protein